MHLETLIIYCDLVDFKSFSRTAEKHFLSQSAISQQLAQLELSLKCQLINRKKRPIEVTAHGQLLYQAARDILCRYDQFNSDMNDLNNSMVSRINVGAIFSIGMHTLPHYVKQFMVKYPKVHVHIEYLDAASIYERILTGKIDVGFVAIPKRDKRFLVYDFASEPLVLVCSVKHKLSNQDVISIHQVHYERFIGFDKDVPTRSWIDNLLQTYNVSVTPVMEFDNIETVKRAVEINSGVSILPMPSVEQEIASGTIRALNFEEGNFYRPTGIVIRKDKILSSAAKYFIDILRKD